MLLGQLYVYDKNLDLIEYPISPKNLQNIDILGLDRRKIGDIPHEESKSLTTKIKNQFISNYLEILKENHYSFAVKFWSDLTSFKKIKQTKLVAQTEFQEKLLEFTKLDKYTIQELIKEAEINHSEEDFAILYGIKALFKLSDFANSKSVNNLTLDFKKSEASADNLIHSPEIVVVTDAEYEPLFVNINCLFIDSSDTLSNITNKVENILNQHSTVKLVLAKKSQNLVTHLQKNLTNPNSSLITSLELGETGEGGYFDKVVKDTLGIRLV